MNLVENEIDDPLWELIGIRTRAREKRMKDIEFVSELYLLIMHGVQEFSQDSFDSFYAKYDDEIPDEDNHRQRFATIKAIIADLDKILDISKTRLKNFGDFYALWSALLELPDPNVGDLSTRLRAFLERLARSDTEDDLARRYQHAVRGGATHKKERLERREVLLEVMRG